MCVCPHVKLSPRLCLSAVVWPLPPVEPVRVSWSKEPPFHPQPGLDTWHPALQQVSWSCFEPAPLAVWDSEPAVLLFSSAHDKFDATFKSNVLVNSGGFCKYLPPGVCLSFTNQPLDLVMISLHFHSITYINLFCHWKLICLFFFPAPLLFFKEYLPAHVTWMCDGFRLTSSAVSWSSAPGHLMAGCWTSRWRRQMCQDTCPVESGICWVRIVQAQDDLQCCLNNSAVLTVPELFIYVLMLLHYVTK